MAAKFVPGTSAYAWSMAPDTTLTEDPVVLEAGKESPGVTTAAAFIAWAAPQVERAEKGQGAP